MATPDYFAPFVGIGGIAVGALLNSWLGLRKDKQIRDEERERHARYLAIRVVCALDPFVIECCDVAADDGQDDAEGYMHTTVNAPDLTLPTDVDWKSIRTDLLYRILSLPNEIDSADKSINFVWGEIASPPDFDEGFTERQWKYAKLGITALNLATDVRNTYELPLPDYGRWNPRLSLEKAIAVITKRAEENAAAIGELIPSEQVQSAAPAPEPRV